MVVLGPGRRALFIFPDLILTAYGIFDSEFVFVIFRTALSSDLRANQSHDSHVPKSCWQAGANEAGALLERTLESVCVISNLPSISFNFFFAHGVPVLVPDCQCAPVPCPVLCEGAATIKFFFARRLRLVCRVNLNLSQTSAQRHRTYFLLNNKAVNRACATAFPRKIL